METLSLLYYPPRASFLGVWLGVFFFFFFFCFSGEGVEGWIGFWGCFLGGVVFFFGGGGFLFFLGQVAFFFFLVFFFGGSW